MTTYRVSRWDESCTTVEADSPEEALEIANNSPEIWDYLPGEPTAAVDE
jgi:hypothetical protein